MPAYEEFRPQDTFSTIECGETPTARVPKFCQSQVPRWEAIIHHHLKRDKVIPSSHPQANEIKHNPNAYEALILLMYPHHPQFMDSRILIQPHPQQGRRSLDEHFCCCEFYYYEQRCYLSTAHNWKDDIHLIRFLDSCQNANILRTLYNQEKHVLNLPVQVQTRAHRRYAEGVHRESSFCSHGWTSFCHFCYAK